MLDWKKLEDKWQKRWAEAKVFEADPDPEKIKYYLTVAYPYPNSPQHIGHGRTYTLTDVHARYRRMQGYNVLFPMAWHYTGTPVIAMVDRLKEKDPDLLDTFVNLYNIPENRLNELETPVGMATYFADEIKNGMQRIGFSIDWRREFTTTDQYYGKFIEWQFAKLKQRGYIIQGSHPVGWCAYCGNPVGQHDTVGDKEPEIEEFIIIKFNRGEDIYPTATLRPETVFGVTNLWINPESQYVRAQVDDEVWVVSIEAVEKLKFLGHKVDVKEAFPGTKLIGLKLINPVNIRELPIFPASFVNPKAATGVVMSVPSHAPYDYVALTIIKKMSKKDLKALGLKSTDVSNVHPISVIELPRWGESPAVDVVEKMAIVSQKDPKLDKATREVYSQEFHNGRMRGNTGTYAGMAVDRAKEAVGQDLVVDGRATTMYELIEPVQCRCGSDVIVKIFENQWFIDYGDQSWKEMAHENLGMMEIIPKELKQEYIHVIDWLKRKACARNVGLGTKLPWAPEWIIEALSDSTIYMAYYTVVKELNRIKPEPEVLTEQFWDYVFLGDGEIDEVSKTTGIPTEELNIIREQFSHFYPLDARHSGRDLIPNHLTFMIFNHTAIWPRENWPRGIIVNGSVLMEGQKMSKSMNNIIPLVNAIERFGSDPLRLTLMNTAEPLKDADFSPELAKSMANNLEKFYNRAIKTNYDASIDSEELKEIDHWMLSRLQTYIQEANEAMKEMKIRKTIHAAFYNLNQDLEWYMQRVKTMSDRSDRKRAIQNVVKTVVETQVKMLAPITPHLCEEIWEAMGNDGFVALETWPSENIEQIRPDAEELESIVKTSLEDIQKIVRVTGLTPSNIYFYTATGWKWKVYLKALQLAEAGNLNIGTLIKEAFKDDEIKTKAKDVPSYARIVFEDVKKTPANVIKKRLNMDIINELKLLQDAKSFYGSELGCEVTVFEESDPWIYDPSKRANRAKPYRPAIFVE